MRITLTNEQLIQQLEQWDGAEKIHAACRSGGGFNYTPVTEVNLYDPQSEIGTTNPPIIYSSYEGTGLTVAELINELKEWPGDFPAFIEGSDPETGHAPYLPVQKVDVWDSDLPPSSDNQLGVEAGDNSWLGGEEWATHPFPGQFLGS